MPLRLLSQAEDSYGSDVERSQQQSDERDDDQLQLSRPIFFLRAVPHETKQHYPSVTHA